jgi:hypothetical protein
MIEPGYMPSFFNNLLLHLIIASERLPLCKSGKEIRMHHNFYTSLYLVQLFRQIARSHSDQLSPTSGRSVDRRIWFRAPLCLVLFDAVLTESVHSVMAILPSALLKINDNRCVDSCFDRFEQSPISLPRLLLKTCLL